MKALNAEHQDLQQREKALTQRKTVQETELAELQRELDGVIGEIIAAGRDHRGVSLVCCGVALYWRCLCDVCFTLPCFCTG